ncbi:MAG: amidohydrolase [Chloroflexi bacterium]|nr:amidohydrolase [Chloroflexota bacterium]
MYLITNGWIVTMDKQRNIYRNGALAIDGSRITEVGETNALKQKYPQAEIIDATNKVVIPGLVNGHVHLFQVLYRGLGDDLALADWLSECIYRMSLNLTGNDVYHATLLAATEMLKGGVTCYVDSHYINWDLSCQDKIAEATVLSGIRGIMGRSTVDVAPVPEKLREAVDQAIRESERIIKTYHNQADGLLKVRLEPLNEALASTEMMLAMREVSRQYGVGMNMHMMEALPRVRTMTAKFGMTPVKYLYKLGILDSDLLLAHCCWVDDVDMDLIAETGAKVAHNPVSNQYLADGVAPVPRMLEKGIVVTIGSDGACSNNNHDMFEAMKLTALMHKVKNLDPEIMTAEKVLTMATIDAARALGLEDEIGSLEAGKRADVVLVDIDHPSMTPCFNPVSNLVYAATSNAVNTVLVNGRIVVQDRNLLTLDEEKVLHDANQAAWNLAEKSGAINQ